MGQKDEQRSEVDQRAEDESDSKDNACKQDTTVQDSNTFDKYVSDKNYDPEWMEMDEDYNQNITTEFRWTYHKEPKHKDDLHEYDGPGLCWKNIKRT